MSGYQIDKSLWGGSEFDALLAEVRKRRQEFEAQRYISQDIIERFQKIGVYRAMVPKALGGMSAVRWSSCRWSRRLRRRMAPLAGWPASA